MTIRDPNMRAVPEPEPEIPLPVGPDDRSLEELEAAAAAEKARREALAKPPAPAAAPVMPVPPVDPSAETLTKRNVETVKVPVIDPAAFYGRRSALLAKG